jgi:hypothetical protein
MITRAVRAPRKKETIRLIWIKIQAGAVGSLRCGGRCVLARLPPMPFRRCKRHGDGLRDDDADQAGPEHDDISVLNASFFQRAHASSNVVFLACFAVFLAMPRQMEDKVIDVDLAHGQVLHAQARLPHLIDGIWTRRFGRTPRGRVDITTWPAAGSTAAPPCAPRARTEQFDTGGIKRGAMGYEKDKLERKKQAWKRLARENGWRCMYDHAIPYCDCETS